MRTKDYSILAGVLLAVTGCEAMFAKLVPVSSTTIFNNVLPFLSLGQFNAFSIRVCTLTMMGDLT